MHRRYLRSWQRGLALLLMLSIVIGCSPRPAPEAASLKIGVIAPFSDEYAVLGDRVRNGAVLAAETWNRQGGVLGQQVQLVLKDSHCTYAGGRNAAAEAIDEGVVFIIGAVCATASEGVAQVAGEANVLQITPASVNLDLTLDADGELRPLVFRVPSVDPDQGTVAAQYALAELGASTAGVLYAEESAYGTALAEAFRASFEAGGGKVVALEVYDQDSELFYESLEGVRDAEPDLLYMPGYYDVINRLVLQARSFGLLQPILGSDGWHAPGLDLDVAEGAAFTSHFYTDEQTSDVRAWVELYEARYMTAPDALATMSYDATNLLLIGIVAAGIGEPVIVAQVLEALSFEGVSGTWTYDSAHNPVKSLIMLGVENGRLVWKGRHAPIAVQEENVE